MPPEQLLQWGNGGNARRWLHRRLRRFRLVDEGHRQNMTDAAAASRRMLVMATVATMACMVAVTAERLHEAGRQAVVTQLEQQSLARGCRHVAGRNEGAHYDAGQQDRDE